MIWISTSRLFKLTGKFCHSNNLGTGVCVCIYCLKFPLVRENKPSFTINIFVLFISLYHTIKRQNLLLFILKTSERYIGIFLSTEITKCIQLPKKLSAASGFLLEVQQLE